MLSRRNFLKSSALLALAPTVPGFLAQTARAAEPKHDGRVLVVIELNGGNDGINTIVPFADEGYARHRKTLGLPTDTPASPLPVPARPAAWRLSRASAIPTPTAPISRAWLSGKRPA